MESGDLRVLHRDSSGSDAILKELLIGIKLRDGR